MAIDKESGLEQHFYLDDEVNLERLSHPVSGQEYLSIEYPRKLINSIQRFFAPNLIKLEIAPSATRKNIWQSRIIPLLFLAVPLVLAIGLGMLLGVDSYQNGEWGTLATAAVILLSPIVSFLGRNFIPIVPHTMNQTLSGYDGHNIDNLIKANSPSWLNRIVYPAAWPEYNQRTTLQKNNQNEHLNKVSISTENMSQLGIESSVEHFLKKYVNEDHFDTISPEKTTRVQRALLVIWTFNPPIKTSISGKLNEKFHELSKRALAQNIYDYISKLEDDRMSPATKEQFVLEYGPSGTFDEKKADALFEDLKAVYHNTGPPLRRLLLQLEE